MTIILLVATLVMISLTTMIEMRKRPLLLPMAVAVAVAAALAAVVAAS